MHATATKSPIQSKDTVKTDTAVKHPTAPEIPQQVPLWAEAAVPAIQFKLKVNRPDDEYEREADRVAEQVMRMPETAVQRKTCACGKPMGPDGMCKDCKKKRQQELQRTAAGDAPHLTAPSIVNQVISQPGRPLDAPTRHFMESRMGQDFGRVRVHTGSKAAESAQAVNARAFTVGSDVVFGSGEYAPRKEKGRRLLAHELTHVMQQSDQLGASQRLYRWQIDGNTATAEGPGDYLGRLATQVGANFRDWKCIKPLKMKTHESGSSPADFNERYERYVRTGDTFDISNLTETNGQTLNLYLFDDTSEALDAGLAQLFYPGSQSTIGADSHIDSASNSGTNPIGRMVIFGHAGGDSMWGNASTFTPSDYNSEEPKQSHTLASVGLFPRRCWFTRNASVRSVGCDSEEWGNDFADAYLREGAEVVSTTESVWSKCQGAAYDPATNSCTAYNGVEFRDSPVAPANVLEGPFWSAADFHAGTYWTTIDGEL